MELYIGGYAQGKLTYVTDRHPGKTSGVGWSHRDIYRENIEGGAGLQPLSSVGEEAA